MKKMSLKTFGELFKILESWTGNLEYVPIVDLMAAGGRTPWEMLVSTMLSARTRDEVTAEVSRNLFKIADTPEKTALIDPEELEKIVYRVGFFRMKAKHLSKLAKIVSLKYSGKVPETLDELISLPGVGIKTATLVYIKAFDGFEICVDTHVHRITNLWGVVETSSPEETRVELKKRIDKKYWKNINQFLVTLGQKICTPRKRKCKICPLYEKCPSRDS